MKKCFWALLMVSLCMFLMACGSDRKEKVLIYSSAEDYKIEHMSKRLKEKFPNYEIIVEYMSTGNHAAKLLSEGTKTECDITHDLEYGYMEHLDSKNIFAQLSYNKSAYVEDALQSENYVPECRVGGCVIINKQLLDEKGLEVPQSYDDLLHPEYRGLISMPNPKSSGTGYMFLKALVNEKGEDEAFAYFDKLTPNILQYTSSGSGPVNALLHKEAVIGLGMIGQTVSQINQGAPLEIIFFKEGAPYTIYGQAIINGKEQSKAVKEVFEYMISTLNHEMCEKFFPEKIYLDRDFVVDNYPTNIKYANMKNNNINEKLRLLDKWNY